MRAIRILKEADLVLAEDTRTSSVLLKHFDIRNRLVAHHKFNEHGTSSAIVERLKGGETIALISDAGTPGISDPGFYLAREAAKAGITVQTLPGPTACIPAIVSSGLPCDRFCFEGFIPQKKGRQTYLESLKDEVRTMIFYEAPHKLCATLDDLAEAFGPGRRISLCRELTKLHEEVRRTTLGEAAEWYGANPPRGEFVLVVEGAAGTAAEAPTLAGGLARVEALRAEGLSLRDAVRQAARETGLAKNELYDRAVGKTGGCE